MEEENYLKVLQAMLVRQHDTQVRVSTLMHYVHEVVKGYMENMQTSTRDGVRSLLWEHTQAMMNEEGYNPAFAIPSRELAYPTIDLVDFVSNSGLFPEDFAAAVAQWAEERATDTVSSWVDAVSGT